MNQKKVCILLAQDDASETLHNQQRSPWGPTALRLSAGTWSAKDDGNFSDFLNDAEVDLRLAHARKERGPLMIGSALRG
jgi:hypothetical protein